MQPNAPDKTRSEDARAVLQKLVDEVRKAHDALEANGHGGDREDRRFGLLEVYQQKRDALLKHIVEPPKPEPVWRSNEQGCDYAMIDGWLHMRETGSEDVHKLRMSADLICGLAADYHRQQGVTVPEEAVKAGEGHWSTPKILEAALPSLLAANQPQQRKPKARQYVVADAEGFCYAAEMQTREQAGQQMRKLRAFQGALPELFVLALVDPEEVQP